MRASQLPESRAEPVDIAPPTPLPGVGDSLRAALSDFFFNSLRLVGANLVWGAFLLVLVALTLTNLLAALVPLILLALPTAGIFRLAAITARDDPATFSDSLAAWRKHLLPALGIGVVVGVGSVVLLVNVVIGLNSDSPFGWAFATAAGWGLLAMWAIVLAFWPLLVDPRRSNRSLGYKFRLAVTVVLVAPGRYALLLVIVFAIIFASTIMFAALVTVSISYVALVMCRYVLPAADRLERTAQEAR